MRLSQEEVLFHTRYAKMHYETLKEGIEAYETDSQSVARMQARECKTCYYLKNAAAMQAFTSYTCKNCEKEEMYQNSHVPSYCMDCSNAYSCCVRCGAGLE